MKVLVLLLLIASTATGAPVPEGGQYAFQGQPSFVTGFWMNSDFEKKNYSMINVNTVDGYTSNYLTPVGNPSAYPTSALVRALSFQCFDNTTFRVIYQRAYYIFGFQPLLQTFCSIRRVENNILKVASTFLDGSAADSCPDESDLPTGNETVVVKNVSKMSLVLLLDPTIAQGTTSTVCVNQTQTTTNWTLPLSTTPVTTYGEAPICADFSNIDVGPNNAQGVWFDASKNVALISTTLGTSSSVWENPYSPSSLVAFTGAYNTSQCMNGAVSGAAQWVQARYLNGSDGPGQWVCAGYQTIPNPLNGNPVMNLYFPIPMPPPTNGTLPKPQLSFNRVAPVPGNPNMTCVNPNMTIKCTWEGVWKISPRFHPCNRHYLSYANKCAVDAVTLETAKDKAFSNNWGLNYSATATGSSKYGDILAIRSAACKDTILAGPILSVPGSPILSLKNTSYLLKLVPYKGKCDDVYILANDGPSANNYLTAPNSCDRFEWTWKPSGRARFTLTKASELTGGGG